MFCPSCGDIRQTTKTIFHLKSKSVDVIYCNECGKTFLYKPLNEKEVKKIYAASKKNNNRKRK